MFYFNIYPGFMENKMIKKLFIKFLIISYKMDTLAYNLFNKNKK